MNDNDNMFLCTMRELTDDEPGAGLGYRVRVEQFDGDAHHFADTRTQSARQRAEAFVACHGLTLVSINQMDQARATLG